MEPRANKVESGQKDVPIFCVSLEVLPQTSPSYPGEQAGAGAVLGDFGELWLAQTPPWTVRCRPQCPMNQWSPPGRANTPSLQRTGSRSCQSGVRTGRRRGGSYERKLGRNWWGLRTTLHWGRNAEELETFPRSYSANLLELLPETVGTREGRDWRAAVPPALGSRGWEGKWQEALLLLNPGGNAWEHRSEAAPGFSGIICCFFAQTCHFGCLRFSSKLYKQHKHLTFNLKGIAFNFSKYCCILDLACQGQNEDKRETQPTAGCQASGNSGMTSHRYIYQIIYT